jgi:hypothetical protein
MSLNIGPFGIMTVIHAILALFLIIELGLSAWRTYMINLILATSRPIFLFSCITS